jgi:uncharacterized membrane protein
LFEALFKYSRADYARSDLVFSGDLPAWTLYLLAVVAVIAIGTLLYYRRATAKWYQLAVIGSLQLGMVALVIWVLLQPGLATEQLRDGENSIALVLDNSSSMSYGTPDSRFRSAAQSLSGALQDGELPGVAVRYYELGAAAVRVDNFLASAPTEGATAIADGLLEILEDSRFSPLAAIVLSSDGADTSGGLTADELAELAAYGIPVHTIGVGRTQIPEDIELSDVTIPDTAPPGSTLPARVTVLHDAPGTTAIKIYDDDELLQLVPLELAANAGSTTAWIDVELGTAGPHQLQFSIEGVTGETELRNNSRSALVNVGNQDNRVLYFEGEPRWEYKFMRRAVDDDEDLRISTLLRVSPNKFYRQGISSPEQLEAGFPTSRDELFAYDALILGSVEAAMLTDEQQSIIRDFVSERGGSLLMLAGPSGLGNGGWGQSLIADVLPARLPPTATDTFHRKKAGVSLTPQGQSVQMLRFDSDDDANSRAWAELPEVADYQVIGELKPAAIALLNAETDIGQIPLLISQPYGRGNAYILATGGTWRWQMSLPLEDQKHETFWRQLLRALVTTAPENVSLTSKGDKRNGTIQLRAEFRDDAFRPVDDIGVTAVASHEGGESFSVSLAPGKEPGVFVGEFAPGLAGTWYFEALAERNGEAVGVSRSSILYESGQSEFFGFRKNAGLLQRLSAATGGRYFEPGDLSGLADLLRYSSPGITETELRAIWDAPIVFLLLLLLKGSEWLFRRRWSSI